MLDCGYRLDLVVENQVIVEIKSVSSLAPIHEAQMLSYLKMSDCHRGNREGAFTELLQKLCES